MQTKEFIYNTIYNVYNTKIIKNHYYVEIYHPHALLALFKTDCCSKCVRIPATTVWFLEWNWNSGAVYSNVENCNRISNEIHFFLLDYSFIYSGTHFSQNTHRWLMELMDSLHCFLKNYSYIRFNPKRTFHEIIKLIE